jgi:transcriptional regulator with XRE-family HTH domain
MSRFQHVFKSLRVRENLTQAELAIKMGMSRSTIGMYEQGRRAPGIEDLEAIADFFNVDMNYLTGKFDENYYTDLQTRQIAQALNDNPELKILIEAGRGVKPEVLLSVAETLKKLK